MHLCIRVLLLPPCISIPISICSVRVGRGRWWPTPEPFVTQFVHLTYPPRPAAGSSARSPSSSPPSRILSSHPSPSATPISSACISRKGSDRSMTSGSFCVGLDADGSLEMRMVEKEEEEEEKGDQDASPLGGGRRSVASSFAREHAGREFFSPHKIELMAERPHSALASYSAELVRKTRRPSLVLEDSLILQAQLAVERDEKGAAGMPASPSTPSRIPTLPTVLASGADPPATSEETAQEVTDNSVHVYIYICVCVISSGVPLTLHPYTWALFFMCIYRTLDRARRLRGGNRVLEVVSSSRHFRVVQRGTEGAPALEVCPCSRAWMIFFFSYELSPSVPAELPSHAWGFWYVGSQEREMGREPPWCLEIQSSVLDLWPLRAMPRGQETGRQPRRVLMWYVPSCRVFLFSLVLWSHFPCGHHPLLSCRNHNHKSPSPHEHKGGRAATCCNASGLRKSSALFFFLPHSLSLVLSWRAGGSDLCPFTVEVVLPHPHYETWQLSIRLFLLSLC